MGKDARRGRGYLLLCNTHGSAFRYRM